MAVVPQQLPEDLSSMLVLDDISDSSYQKLMVESDDLFGEHVVISVVVEGEVVCSDVKVSRLLTTLLCDI